jgi:SAM-dependent methyltransferase
MTKEFYEQTAAVEDTHWYMVARRRLADCCLRQMRNTHYARAFECGCGTGGNLSTLLQWAPDVTGIDLSPIALEIARKKHPTYNFLLGDANRMSELFPASSFDLAFLFNMLYHRWIVDDQRVIDQIYALLRPGGILLLFEPAFMFLWRHHDEADMGKTRYRLPDLAKKLRLSGFIVRRQSYFNAISFIPALLLALKEGRMHGSARRKGREAGEVAELSIPSPLVNRGVLALMTLERMWIRLFGRVPFGTTAFLAAQKPDAPGFFPAAAS